MKIYEYIGIGNKVISVLLLKNLFNIYYKDEDKIHFIDATSK